jgi:predicted RNA-binding Zn ribbon-like protein
MRLSQRHPLPVPREFALLYEFANSLDLRRYVQHGSPLPGGDEFTTSAQLELWMRRRNLLKEGVALGNEDHQKALKLRESLRMLLHAAPSDRRAHPKSAELLNESAANFPLILQMSTAGKIELNPAAAGGSSGLARVLAELLYAADTAKLDRLKMCCSNECQWVFYDRSKPGTRRWCASAICGNRQKTRAYRQRQKEASSDAR